MGNTLNKEGLQHLAEILDEKYQPIGECADKRTESELEALDGRVPKYADIVKTFTNVQEEDGVYTFTYSDIELSDGKEIVFCVNGKNYPCVLRFIENTIAGDIYIFGNGMFQYQEIADITMEFGGYFVPLQGLGVAALGRDYNNLKDIYDIGFVARGWANKLPADAIDLGEYKELTAQASKCGGDASHVLYAVGGIPALSGDFYVNIEGNDILAPFNQEGLEVMRDILGGDGEILGAWGNGAFLSLLVNAGDTLPNNGCDIFLYQMKSYGYIESVLIYRKPKDEMPHYTDVTFICGLDSYEGLKRRITNLEGNIGGHRVWNITLNDEEHNALMAPGTTQIPLTASNFDGFGADLQGDDIYRITTTEGAVSRFLPVSFMKSPDIVSVQSSLMMLPNMYPGFYGILVQTYSGETSAFITKMELEI